MEFGMIEKVDGLMDAARTLDTELYPALAMSDEAYHRLCFEAAWQWGENPPSSVPRLRKYRGVELLIYTGHSPPAMRLLRRPAADVPFDPVGLVEEGDDALE